MEVSWLSQTENLQLCHDGPVRSPEDVGLGPRARPPQVAALSTRSRPGHKPWEPMPADFSGGQRVGMDGGNHVSTPPPASGCCVVPTPDIFTVAHGFAVLGGLI